MGEKKYTDVHPNAFVEVQLSPEGEAAVIGIKCLSGNVDDPVLVWFSRPLCEPPAPAILQFDEERIVMEGYTFENLGYNIRIDAYVGRLIEEKEVVNG